MLAWSDGLNYFLSRHPAVTPKVIRHFEPWMALSFTEGSIGGDIETVDLGKLQKFYATRRAAARFTRAAPPPGGSNGFAIAPKLQRDRDMRCCGSIRIPLIIFAANCRWSAMRV